MIRYLRDETGAETLEWVAVGGLVVAAIIIAITVEVSPGLNDASHLLRLLLVGLFQ